MRNGFQEKEKSNESRGKIGTHGTKPKSHSSGNLPGHEGLNGRPVCVFAVKMNWCAGKQLQRKRTYITHTFVAFVEGWLHEADGTPFHGSFNPPDYLRTRYSKVPPLSKVNTKTSEGTSEGTKVNVRYATSESEKRKSTNGARKTCRKIECMCRQWTHFALFKSARKQVWNNYNELVSYPLLESTFVRSSLLAISFRWFSIWNSMRQEKSVFPMNDDKTLRHVEIDKFHRKMACRKWQRHEKHVTKAEAGYPWD